MDRDFSQLRAGDAERNETIELLSQCAADGRLSIDEHTERMERAAGATTYADLDACVNDLPVALSWHNGTGTGTRPQTGLGRRLAYPEPVRQHDADPGFDQHDPLKLKSVWFSENRRGPWTPRPSSRSIRLGRISSSTSSMSRPLRRRSTSTSGPA